MDRKAGALLCFASLLWGCAPIPREGNTLDPVSEDPVSLDSANPAFTRAVVIPSDGARMNGLAFVAQGAGPHPTVVLLHGLPGHGGLRDLAEVIRRAGWNVLTFQYRGAWGSEGAFSLAHVLEDVAAAVAFVRGPEAASLRSSGQQIVLVGHSVGGWAALMGAASDPKISGVASVAGLNVGRAGQALVDDQRFASAIRTLQPAILPLQGTSAEAIAREERAHGGDWDLVGHVPALINRPVLLVSGNRDTTAPRSENHIPLVAEFERRNARLLDRVDLETDHSFPDRRVALAKTLVSWLNELTPQ
jgi:uncharacterized protein